jgi:hypothetical protein
MQNPELYNNQENLLLLEKSPLITMTDKALPLVVTLSIILTQYDIKEGCLILYTELFEIHSRMVYYGDI